MIKSQENPIIKSIMLDIKQLECNIRPGCSPMTNPDFYRYIKDFFFYPDTFKRELLSELFGLSGLDSICIITFSPLITRNGGELKLTPAEWILFYRREVEDTVKIIIEKSRNLDEIIINECSIPDINQAYQNLAKSLISKKTLRNNNPQSVYALKKQLKEDPNTFANAIHTYIIYRIEESLPYDEIHPIIKERDTLLGKVLGYPSCCINAYNNLNTNIPQYVIELFEEYFSDIKKALKGERIIEIVSRLLQIEEYTSIFAEDFFPCSYNCENAFEIKRKIIEHLDTTERDLFRIRNTLSLLGGIIGTILYLNNSKKLNEDSPEYNLFKTCKGITKTLHTLHNYYHDLKCLRISPADIYMKLKNKNYFNQL